MERRLAAIVVADVAGYSAMMEQDEADTLSRLFALRAQLVEPAINDHGGDLIKTMGDGLLAEFPSVVNAVAASVSVQEGLEQWPDVGQPLQLRIGIHLGDVAVRDGDLYGDGVNIAARLEQAAEPGGIAISGTAHEQLAGHYQDQFTDAGALQLKNIARPVRVWQWTHTPQAGRPQQPRLATRPSIAVLPFDNLSGDPDQDFFAEGMVEDLTTMLSRFHWFRVIARNSTKALGPQADLGQIAETLGARYLLQGSVRKAGSRIRVGAQLADTETGTQIWGDRFDRVFEDLFDVQDEIVQAIVGAVVPSFVSFFGTQRTASQRTTISSWELAMRGWSMVNRRDLPDALLRARKLFEEALAVDPESTLALSGLAFTYGNPFYQAGSEWDIPQALETARRAVELDDQNAFAWALLGAAETWRSNLDEAERFLKRAIGLNPNLAFAHGYLGAVSGFQGDVIGAEAWTERMKELSPADPGLPGIGPQLAYFIVGDYENAIRAADQIIADAPELPPPWRIRTASLELLGDHEAAAEAAERLMALGPINIEWLRENLTVFADEAAFERYLEALRRAGIPDRTSNNEAATEPGSART